MVTHVNNVVEYRMLHWQRQVFNTLSPSHSMRLFQ